MRRLLLAFPILTLSACSFFESPQLNPYGVHAQNAHYQHGYTHRNNAQNCVWTPCPQSPDFPVASQGNTHANLMPHRQYYSPPSAYALRRPSYIGQIACCSNAHHFNDAQPHQLRGMHRPPAYDTVANVWFGPESQGVYTHVPQYTHAPQLRGMQYQNSGSFYGTLGGVLYDDDSEIFGIEGRLGYDSGHIFGAEIEGSIGVIDENKVVNEPSIGDVDLNIESNYNIAAFAVARVPISPNLSVHGRAGYDFRQLNVDGTAQDGTSETVSGKLEGFALGAGAEYSLSQRSGLRFDVTRYHNNVGSIESISASFTRKF